MAYCGVGKRDCSYLDTKLDETPRRDPDDTQITLGALCAEGFAIGSDAEVVVCGVETAFNHEEEFIIAHDTDGLEEADAS